jgi:hypothetical protein
MQSELKEKKEKIIKFLGNFKTSFNLRNQRKIYTKLRPLDFLSQHPN